MQNWESAAANYAAQQQAMGFPNMGSEDPYAASQQVRRSCKELFKGANIISHLANM